MGENKKGVILLNLGGPDSINAVRPFLYSLFSDREIIKLGPAFLQKSIAWMIASTRSRKTKKHYKLIGGGSPILEITNSQAKALQKSLDDTLKGFRVYIGMRYWHPTIKEAVIRMSEHGIHEVIALPLFPQYSKATTGSCFNELKKVSVSCGQELAVNYVESWYRHPLYVKALSEGIVEGLKGFGAKKQEVTILFSAHSLPKTFIDEGDPYVKQIHSTITELEKIMDLGAWKLSFQSRSGPVEWIGPSTEEMIKQLATERATNVLMVPISFVSDHIETLYEMDILYKSQAAELGITLLRAPSLNASSGFIEALANIVKTT